MRERILRHQRHLHVMSGETSSPADGGQISRGLPPSVALRWFHYRFVSPVHCSTPASPRLLRIKVRGATKLAVLWVFVFIWGISPCAHAEFSYQNPARQALDESEVRATSPRQLVTTRFQRQETVRKLESIALEKEINRMIKEQKKALAEAQRFRQLAQQYLETEKQRATQKTQSVRATRELGFEYFRHQNGMVELYKDGLVGAILNEPVPETDIEGQIGGTTMRDTVDIEYFIGGPYHRMRKHFKVVTRRNDRETQILERDILEYVSGSKWYGTDDPNLTNNFQMVQKYKDITWTSVSPYKKEIRLVSGVSHRGDRRPSEWLEARGATDGANLTLTLYKGADYNASKELNYYQSISWASQFPEVATVAEWSAEYKNGFLTKETIDSVDLASFTMPPDIATLAESLLLDVEQDLERTRHQLRENPPQKIKIVESLKENPTPDEDENEKAVSAQTQKKVDFSQLEPVKENAQETHSVLSAEKMEGGLKVPQPEEVLRGALPSNQGTHKIPFVLQDTVNK